MKKKYKKWIYVCISLFVICLSAGLIAVNLMAVNDDTEYESYDTGHKTDMTKKTDYQKADLEAKLQDAIQSIVEGSSPLVSIHNFDTSDHSETTVAVTLYTDPHNEVSEESQTAVENLIVGSFDGILKDNISINIEHTK